MLARVTPLAASNTGIGRESLHLVQAVALVPFAVSSIALLVSPQQQQQVVAVVAAVGHVVVVGTSSSHKDECSMHC